MSGSILLQPLTGPFGHPIHNANAASSNAEYLAAAILWLIEDALEDTKHDRVLENVDLILFW